MAEATTVERTGNGIAGFLPRLAARLRRKDAGAGSESGDNKAPRGHWRRIRPVTLLCLALLLVGLAVRIFDPPFVETLRVKTFDLYQRIAPRPAKPYPVAIIDIDEKSLAEIGQWPWPRSVIGDLITQATRQGAAVIGFDIVFAEYDRLSPQQVARTLRHLDETTRKALEKLPSNEAVMAAAMRRSRVVAGQVGLHTDLPPGKKEPPTRSSVAAQIGGDPRPLLYHYKTRLGNVPEIEAAAKGHGLFSVGEEFDGVIRRVPLVYVVGKKIYPGLTAEMLRVAFGGRTIATKRDAAGMKSIIIQTPRGHYEIPTDRNGRIWVHFSKPDTPDTPDNSGRLYISAVDILKGRLPKGKLRGKLAIVGTSAVGLKDIRATPIAGRLPGVEVHANILETIFAARGAFDAKVQEAAQKALAALPQEVRTRYEEALKKARAAQRARQKIPDEVMQDIRAAQGPVKAAIAAQKRETPLASFFLRYPNFANSAEMAIMLVAGILLIILIPRLGPMWTLAGLVVAGAAFVGTSWYLYTEHRLLIDVTYPGAVTVAIYSVLTFANYTREAAEKRQVRGAFGQYLSPALVEQLANNPDRLRLGGETKEMTFLFCDVRGFTTISEQYKSDPQGLTVLINRLLTPLTECILERDGTIDKYMGDCIMAFWNAPLDVPEHAVHACDAALAMFDALEALNREREAEAEQAGIPFLPLRIGIGINTGECVVGNMGSQQRFDYSVLGDAVNLASRLEGQSKTYGVGTVIGPDTAAQASDRFAVLELDLIAVKGKKEAVRIFGLLGDSEMKASSSHTRLVETHEAMLTAYRAQSWDEAETLIRECRTIDGAPAGLYDLYVERLLFYRENPPGPDWDGVFVATTK